MRRILKRIVIVSILLIALLVGGLALFLFFDSPKLLEPIEEEGIKKGKKFWEWSSPNGPLAMHYIEEGEGDKHLLFLHGFRAHTFTWKALIKPLVQNGYHVWAIDLIGFGLSDKPTQPIYTLDFFIDQIYAFMEGNGIEQAHLAGNSMGGGLALATAISHPEKVSSLTLLSPLGYPLELPLYLVLSRYLSKFSAPFIGPALVRYGLEQIVYHQEKITDDQVDAYSFPYRLPGGVDASAFTLQEFDNEKLVAMSRHYQEMRNPILVIWGEHDHLIPVDHYHHFVKDFPHADKKLIPCCGHIPQEEAPDEVLAAILPFLDNLIK